MYVRASPTGPLRCSTVFTLRSVRSMVGGGGEGKESKTRNSSVGKVINLACHIPSSSPYVQSILIPKAKEVQHPSKFFSVHHQPPAIKTITSNQEIKEYTPKEDKHHHSQDNHDPLSFLQKTHSL